MLNLKQLQGRNTNALLQTTWCNETQNTKSLRKTWRTKAWCTEPDVTKKHRRETKVPASTGPWVNTQNTQKSLQLGISWKDVEIKRWSSTNRYEFRSRNRPTARATLRNTIPDIPSNRTTANIHMPSACLPGSRNKVHIITNIYKCVHVQAALYKQNLISLQVI